MAADLVARHLGRHSSYAVECMGDIRVGGQGRRLRPVEVPDPFGGDEPVGVLKLRRGAVATSATTRRAGHLIDPRTGEPAETGVAQVTAMAPTGLEAEIRAKAALLSGPRWAAAKLPHGGVIVLDSGTVLAA
jgi:thiamine biosynthesis lipoprotein